MPKLTVTHDELNKKTQRTSGALKYIGHRSYSFLTMLAKLKIHEYAAGDGAASLVVLKSAARTWRRNHSKEFIHRDQLSGYLCTKLLTELSVLAIGYERPESNCAAYQIVVDKTAVDILKAAKGKFTASGWQCARRDA
jgi:hypothetical protein